MALESNCSHLDYAGEECPECKERVDAYGNTESVFEYCSFPDCGCDGARLCMAGEASERALGGNVESMWSGRTRAQRAAVMALMYTLHKESQGGAS